ncbi:hypothetical protein Pan181_34610 [Aeoliella mucimassa]|uniref:Uncharacterized protein n=1 Tax=Aeoliella mucimassa TaxID=2527972 RepID=A0A518AR96_9BACT|nr:hypothetical protein Pan181_34610 [Aeoliella mucimassa]
MQLITHQRLAISAQRENRFPLDAFWEMGIYSSAKTTGFTEYAVIQFSHRWVNWESICSAVGMYSSVDEPSVGCKGGDALLVMDAEGGENANRSRTTLSKVSPDHARGELRVPVNPKPPRTRNAISPLENRT